MAMARQQEVMSDESPKETHNGDEHPPRTESKRKKFRPFRAVRNMFRKRMRRQVSENFQDYKKSRSTTELQNDEDGVRRFSGPNSPYSVGLSVSHDSIFSPDHATTSLDPQELRSIHGFLSVQHVELKDLKNELFARIRARRDSDDEDVGLPHSPCTSPTTADILSQNLKSKSGISRTTCSEGSLISMGSSENDEDLMGMVLSSHPSRMSLSDKRLQDSDETDVSQPVPLSHKAAHHKISVRPKRTHGLPRHRKQQLAASKLGSLPSTPEISEDSGRPSSVSLQSSEMCLSEMETSGMESQPSITSIDTAKKSKSPGEAVVSDSTTNLSPVSPNEQQKNLIHTKIPKSEISNQYINEPLDSRCSNIESKNVSLVKENTSPSTPSDEKKLDKDCNKTSDGNSSNDKTEKETKGVFSAWGAKMRKSTDTDKSEKVSKNDQDDGTSEPFLSRWFGSRRNHSSSKRSSDECSSTPSTKDVKQCENQVSPVTDTKYFMDISGKNEEKLNTGIVLEKKNLFLNLEIGNTHNGTGLRNFTQSQNGSFKERMTKSQNIIGQCQLESECKEISNKQVIKSSSDDCVHYSLISGKPQNSSPNSQDQKPKPEEKYQEREMESRTIIPSLTTWADLKKAQNLKQDFVLNSHHKDNLNIVCKEVQRAKLFNGQAVEKVSQCERPSSLDIIKQTSDPESPVESNCSYTNNRNNNIKNISTNIKHDSINGGVNEIDILKSTPEKGNKNVESPKPNGLKSETKEIFEKKQESENSDSKFSPVENNDKKVSTTISSDDRSTPWNLLSSDKDQLADNIKEQHGGQSVTAANSKPSITCNTNNGHSWLPKSSNSVSKHDIKSHLTNNENVYGVKSPENNEKSSTDLKSYEKNETTGEALEQTGTDTKKDSDKTSPKQLEDVHSRDGIAAKDFQHENSLPPTSELFRVFARRSIKQKHIDKQNMPVDSPNHVNEKENIKTENNSVNATKLLKDRVIDKGTSDTIVQNEKAQEILIPRPHIVPASTQSKESHLEKRTQKNITTDITQEIHIPRPRSHTTSEPSQPNDSATDMRTRKSSVPESSRKTFIKSKEEPQEEVKLGRAINDRDKSKSFKLNNIRNSPPDTRSADDNLQPSWLRLAQQRREQREQKEKQLRGSSSPSASETIAKPNRSTKVLDMVSNFQKLQMT